MMRILFLTILLCMQVAVSYADTSIVETPEATVQLLHERSLVNKGDQVRLGFYFSLKPHWHIYWKNPGDSGLPPKIEWQKGTSSYRFSQIDWPIPKRISLKVLANYGYENEVLLPLVVTQHSSESSRIVAKLSWLVCKEECIPREGLFELNPTSKPSLNISFNTAQPQPLDGWKWQSFKVTEDTLVATLFVPFEIKTFETASFDFFPAEENLVKTIRQPEVSVSHKNGQTELGFRFEKKTWAPDKQITSLDGLLFVSHDRVYELDSQTSPSQVAVAFSEERQQGFQSQGFSWWILLFAFLGGALLNLMPCVFPILALKVFDFSHRQEDSQAELKIQSYFFMGGVLVCFWGLAAVLFFLRAQGHFIGWGFQLQSPSFIVFLIALFMLLSLNFWGLFEINLPFLNRALSVKIREGRLGSFLTGLLTTFVSTPCTAPMLGIVFGAALTLPLLQSLMIFTIMGFGVAFPYVLLVHIDFLRKKMPKPGPWMQQLKELLGFLLFGTVIWLLWVLGKQNELAAMVWAMSGLLLLALGVWWKGVCKIPVRSVAFVLALMMFWAARTKASAEADWQKFDQAILEEQSKSRIVFLDFTASWCLTCQVNKAVALDNPKVIEVFKKHKVALFRGDWTNQDAAITKMLLNYGRSSVPTNIVLGPDGAAPVVLPTILTPSIVIEEIERRIQSGTLQ